MARELEAREARVARWRGGCDLGLSWLTYGDERQKQLQAASRGTGGALVYQLLMLADVCARVASGELEAMGYRVARTPSDGPVVIPADLFDGRPGDEIMESRLSVGLEQFERIHIVAAAEPLALQNEQTIEAQTEAIAHSPRSERKRPGPESGGAVLRGLYEELKAAGELPEIHTRKQAYSKVRKLALERHPDKFKGARGLSYQSFCRHLDALES